MFWFGVVVCPPSSNLLCVMAAGTRPEGRSTRMSSRPGRFRKLSRPNGAAASQNAL